LAAQLPLRAAEATEVFAVFEAECARECAFGVKIAQRYRPLLQSARFWLTHKLGSPKND
jgi:hypothetical protein